MISAFVAVVLLLSNRNDSEIETEPYALAQNKPPSSSPFKEAPMLSDQVSRGKLPPVEMRLPEEPLVVEPLEEIGSYGGTWRRMMKGTSDFHAYGRCVYEQMLRWAPDPRDGIRPGLVKEWEFSKDGTELVLHLRKGLKWSDGHPFTTDDVMFWWEKIAPDPNLSGIPREWAPGGEPMRMVAVNKTKLVLEFAKPNFLAEQYLAFKGHQWPLVFERAGFFAPKHYLEKYLPTANDDIRVENAGYALFERKAGDFNTDRPVISAWKPVEWKPGSHMIAKRNPYYWKVDSAGNQLPYVDTIEMEIYLNPEMINFRAISGRLPMQSRHLEIKNMELYREFAPERDYRILQYEDTTRFCIMPNLEYPGNKAIRQIFQDKRFRIALSLSIDRNLICRLVERGYAQPGGIGFFESSRAYSPVDDLPNYCVYDPQKARQLLDEMGLSKRDAEGYRLGPDGKTISLIIEKPDTSDDALEIVRSNWDAVGIKTSLKYEQRTLYFQRVTKSGEHMIGTWGLECVFPLIVNHRWFGFHLWDEWAHHYAKWYQTGGKRGVEPPDEVKRLQEIGEQLYMTADPEKQKQLFREVTRLHAENMWVIPIKEKAIGPGVCANNFRNVPERGTRSWVLMTPGNMNPETFFFRKK
ncbi:MAG: ABC transporter substrate-binding protein [Verrucomicrobiota bacterium]